VVTLGSDAHRALIEQVVAHYRQDGRVRAVAVFGSVSNGTWHELSDVDLDVVTGDGVDVAPGREAGALFRPRAAIVVAGADCADVVLDSLEEVSIRWHPLAATSPNICASVSVVYGRLMAAEIIAAREANRAQPDEQRLLGFPGARRRRGLEDAQPRAPLGGGGGGGTDAPVIAGSARPAGQLAARPRRPGRCARRGDRRGSSVLRFRARRRALLERIGAPRPPR
jgi:predicted nucleotidyltransferase